MIDLTDRIAVVTGGAAGIGRAIVDDLVGAGAAVAIADIDGVRADVAADEIRTRGGRAVAVQVDITDVESVRAMRAQVVAGLGPATIVVNNAGWDEIQPFAETTPEFWDKVIAVNYRGMLAVTHTFLPDLIEAGAGATVVNVASDAGRVGSLGEAVYAGCKGAVIAFTKSLARELARYEVNVNCVCPGPTDTQLFANQPEKVQAGLLRAIPYKRLAQPSDVAHVVAFLASPLSDYMTGQVVSVSGGLTMSG
jgi:2-hydroxycyclohexanecarboxyl-CoA dehydrogenase